MLTGTQNLIITLCSMGITSLIMVLFENTIYVDWDSQLIITSCWLGLTSLIMIFKKRYILCWLGLTTSSLLYVDLRLHHWSWYFIKIIVYVDWDSQHIINHVDLYSPLWSWHILEIYSMLTGTHKLENYIQCNHILCWLGLTTSWLHHVDLDSHLWS